MTTFQAGATFLTVLGLCLGLLRYLHQRNKDKPIFEFFFRARSDKSVLVTVKITNKSRNSFTINKISAYQFCKRLLVANSSEIERKGEIIKIPTHEHIFQKPYIYVPPEGISEFDFFIISLVPIISKTLLIKLQTDANLSSMAPKYKIISRKYAV